MNWLQARLKELGYTHQDLQKSLADHGIVRVRATITGWTNGKPISLLNDPDEAQILADVLDLSLDKMLIAAGYDLGIPHELATFIAKFRAASPRRRSQIVESLDFLEGFLNDYLDEELDEPEPDDTMNQ